MRRLALGRPGVPRAGRERLLGASVRWVICEIVVPEQARRHVAGPRSSPPDQPGEPIAPREKQARAEGSQPEHAGDRAGPHKAKAKPSDAHDLTGAEDCTRDGAVAEGS